MVDLIIGIFVSFKLIHGMDGNPPSRQVPWWEWIIMKTLSMIGGQGGINTQHSISVDLDQWQVSTLPGGHHGHDGPERWVDREQSVLGVEPVAVVRLVAQTNSEPLQGPELRWQVHTHVIPHWLLVGLVKL